MSRYTMSMALPSPMRGFVREVRSVVVITIAAFTLVCAVWIWLAGFSVVPSVIRNAGYGLVMSATTTVAATILSTIDFKLVEGRTIWVRVASYVVALAGAAVVGTFSTAVIFWLAGWFPKAEIGVNFTENIKHTVLITLFVGGIVLLIHEWRDRIEEVKRSVERPRVGERRRVQSRVGGKVEFVDLAAVSYVYAQDKLTFAVTPAKHHPLDLSITELEGKLAEGDWIRIHRSTLINVDAVKALHTDVMGRLFVRLLDGTELRVAKERAAQVRAALKT